MAEYVDIVDEQDIVIGKAEINEAHEKWLLHRAIHIFVINPEEKLFCRQRS